MEFDCLCGHRIDFDWPADIDLDKSENLISEIIDGSFCSCTCGVCGKVHKPAFQLRIDWPSRDIRLHFFPELEREQFLQKRLSAEKGRTAVIGWPELQERMRILKDSFNPELIEILKFHMLLKTDKTVDIYYMHTEEESLVFHIHGLKKDEVGVAKVPASVYYKSEAKAETLKKESPFDIIFEGSYKSLKKLSREDIHS